MTSDELEVHRLAQELLKVNGDQVWVRRMLREALPLTTWPGSTPPPDQRPPLPEPDPVVESRRPVWQMRDDIASAEVWPDVAELERSLHGAEAALGVVIARLRRLATTMRDEKWAGPPPGAGGGGG